MANNDSNVLAISVHPDDETLGCGGTLLKHKAQGDTLYWLIITQAREPYWPADLIQRKAIEVERVAAAYCMKQFYKLNFLPTRLDSTPQHELIDGIRSVINKVRPQTIYLIHQGDVHTDHYAAFTATLSVVKSFYMNRFGVRRVLSYETLSSTEAAPANPSRMFIPGVYSDISLYIEEKIRIMQLYDSEIHADPLPRGPSAIRALARYRGATIGVAYAEAFMPIREVIP